jgi:hypothetical protein
MEFALKFEQIADRLPMQREHIKTEEATKTSIVLPFIQALGYDVFNPQEVVPEYIADHGIKKGEKVDYAIIIDGKPIIIIEVKTLGCPLDTHNSQLFRYFSTNPSTRIGIITNGEIYQFFSDLETPNMMDKKPFLVLNILNLKENVLNQLKELSKEVFNLESMLGTAQDLKYIREFKRIIAEELNHPSQDFIRYFAKKAYDGALTEQKRTYFTELVKLSFKEFISEAVQARLKKALASESGSEEAASLDANDRESTDSGEESDGIDTTEEELEGYRIIRAIARQIVDVSRIAHRDTKSYFGILLDDNNRKPVCRLYFNSKQKYIGTFDNDKNVTRHAITDLDDIYNYANQIKEAIENYEKGKDEEESDKPQATENASPSPKPPENPTSYNS